MITFSIKTEKKYLHLLTLHNIILLFKCILQCRIKMSKLNINWRLKAQWKTHFSHSLQGPLLSKKNENTLLLLIHETFSLLWKEISDIWIEKNT